MPVKLGAEAMLARAELDAARASAEGEAAWRRLAVLWGATEAGPVPRVSGAALELPTLPPLADLLRLVEQSPELRQFADESRIAEARLQLAEASRTTDIEWQVGVRNLQDGDDWALVAGVAVPIGAARRAEPAVRAARAAAARLAVERESAGRALLATLVAAHGQFTAAAIEVTRIRDEWLPRLAAAEAAAGQAFGAGALSYLEWAQLQAETTAARRQQLAAALEAHRALVEIQRLTASITVEGRNDDILSFTNPNGLSVAIMPMALWSVIKDVSGVYRFQAIQTGPGQLKVRLQTKVAGEEKQVWELVKQRAQNYFE